LKTEGGGGGGGIDLRIADADVQTSGEELEHSKKVEVDDVIHAITTGPVECSARYWLTGGSSSGVESAPVAMVAVPGI